MRRLLIVAVLAAVLAGCDSDTVGTVTDKSGYGKYRRLTVQDDTGESRRFRPPHHAFAACDVGDRWPACSR